MPTKFRLRQRLQMLFKSLFKKRSKPAMSSSNDEVLDDFNSIFEKACISMAGGEEEYKKINAWMREHPAIEEIVLFKKERSALSFLVLETQYARIIRRYEEELKLHPRPLGDIDIERTIEYGRRVCLVNYKKDTGLRHAYTVGNSTHELNTRVSRFYPGDKTARRFAQVK